MNETIKAKLNSLPDLPGSYQMLDSSSHIIYVGKAKSLKNRVKSYFVGSHDLKTTKLVHDIIDFTYIVTKSEKEAFLLELSLIKEHKPKYNIMLMDDKTYPYIEITKEEHPKIIITRKVTKKNKNIFGPYPNVFSARETVDLLNRVYPLRKCVSMPKKLCLYYHIGQCLGPCVFSIEPEVTQNIINEIKQFLSGNTANLVHELQKKMYDHSEKLEFEKAKEYKQLIDSVNDTTQKQQIIFADAKDRDIINFYDDGTFIAITILFMRAGKIIFSDSSIHDFYDDATETVLDYLAQFYEKHLMPSEILLPESLENELLESIFADSFLIPKRGDKMKLITTALDNAKIHLETHLDIYLHKQKKTLGATETLAKLIGLESIRRIEAFDNSNTQGTQPVSAMVVFKNGVPDKNSYRKYQVKTIIGPDDYGTMKEIIYRRYQRLLMESMKDRPDLIITDGGLGQVRACKEVLDGLYLDIPVIGLRKDDFHKTDAIIGLDESVIPIDRHSPLYVFLTKVQDEAHRFAITYHREKQTKQIFASILDQIPLIGKASKQKLLEKYKTIEAIKNAPIEELKSLGLSSPAIDNLKIALLAKRE
ncbi:MAG: excinuclease ABC subunit C [Tenericutes bacterium HGW-Tenericutes-1]|nr:MAG: excinuclease ABC subunit C [Tenericutes bacterium HGW-Tenericutes-1]